MIFLPVIVEPQDRFRARLVDVLSEKKTNIQLSKSNAGLEMAGRRRLNDFLYICGWVIFMSIIVSGLYLSGWRFIDWLHDVLEIIWPIALCWAALSLIVARLIRKGADSDTDDPLTRMHYRYNRLEEAYGWMRWAAFAGMVGLITLWLSVRHKL